MTYSPSAAVLARLRMRGPLPVAALDAWLESRYSDDQPRDSDGKFAGGGGGGDGADTGAGSGRDIGRDSAALDRIVTAASGYPEGTADVRFAPYARAAADEQGFSGAPQVVSREEMDRLVAEGHVEAFRGIGGSEAAQHAEDLRSGEAFYTTNAAYGQGMYFTPNQEYAASYARDSGGQVLRVALDKDARVISYDDAHAGAKADFEAALAEHRPGDSASSLILSHDPGVWAITRGYDAILATSTFGDEVVVLNRTALFVEQA